MKFNRSLVCTVALLALAGCQSPSTPATPAAPVAAVAAATPTPLIGKFHYLTGSSLDPDKLLAPFPTSSDPELAEMQALLKKRTAADCKRIASEVEESLKTFYGKQLSKKQVKAWTPIIEAATDDAEIYTDTLKNRFNRVRPYLQAEDKIPTCKGVRMPKSGSYPSGHSTNAWLMANILTQLDPTHKSAFEKRAEQIAHDRVLAGAHFPTDIEAGHKLADELFAALQTVPSFNTDMGKLQKK